MTSSARGVITGLWSWRVEFRCQSTISRRRHRPTGHPEVIELGFFLRKAELEVGQNGSEGKGRAQG